MNRPLKPDIEAFYVERTADQPTRDELPSEETWYYSI